MLKMPSCDQEKMFVRKGVISLRGFVFFLSAFIFLPLSVNAQDTSLGEPPAFEIAPDPVVVVESDTSDEGGVVYSSSGGVDSVSEAGGAEVTVKKKGPPFGATDIQSLFFTYWQHQAILDAKNSRGTARAPTAAELNALPGEEKVKPKPEDREIKLSGIVYADHDDWTIWLNGKRITPNAIPKEVLDLRVFKDYIEVKWLDDYTNQIFPLRLRSHQRFNMDMRIFLPGD
ncbi:MAG: hypothetical protein KDI13_03295 [Alphaproteobacteria bacterium]|nr:hypothetical protein [Alphaproteobacteria bacterium]